MKVIGCRGFALAMLVPLALAAIGASAPMAMAALADDVFCNGFDVVSGCPATPFMVVPNRAWTFVSTPFSTYLSTSATATSLVLNGPSAQTATLAITQQSGNRVDAVIPAFLLPGLWSVQATTLGSVEQSPQLLLITGAPGGLSLASASPAVISDQGLGRVQLFATDPPPASTESFVAMPEVFLQLHGSATPAIRIDDRDFVSAEQIAIIVPAGLTAGTYDVIAINSDGATGALSGALKISANAAPVITKRVPEVSVDQSGQVIKLRGENFGGLSPSVSADCVDTSGSSVGAPLAGNVTTADATDISVTFDFSSLAAGDICRLDLTSADGQVASFANQAISNAVHNLGPTSNTGQQLQAGRRGGVLLAGPSAPEGHRLYMIGGDVGVATAPVVSVESAAIGAFGALGAFRTERNFPSQHMTLAGGVTAGEYLYVVGGDVFGLPTNLAYRSRVLRDARDPVFGTLGAALPPAGATGIGAGLWRYRIAPLVSQADTDNPGGEGLPGAELSIEVPAVQNGVEIVLSFGTTIPNVTGYAIYRSPSPGAASFEHLADVTNAGGETTYTDTGASTNPAVTPLPPGSLAKWYALPAMGSHREAPAVAVVADPSTAGTAYVYAIAGRDLGGVVTTSYEYLPFTTAADGRQTSSTWMLGASGLGAGRANLGSWVVDSDSSANIPSGVTCVYAGPGVDVSGVKAVDAGMIAAGGDLGAWDSTPTDDGSVDYGYSAAQLDSLLYMIGGANGSPSTGVKVATIGAVPPELGPAAWNSEGASLVCAVVYAGAAKTDGFIYLAGGQGISSTAQNCVQRIVQ